MSKICCFFNYNPLYRYPIYKKMSEEFDCDFFFGDTVFEPIKQFDSDKLPGFKVMLKTKRTGIKDYIWHAGARKLFSTRYSHYILTGDSRLLVVWLLMLWAKVSGKKTMLWTHGVHEHYSKFTTRLIYSTFYRLADVLLMYGNYNRQYMLDLGCSKKKLFTIHNSLDTERQTEIYAGLKPSNIYSEHFQNDFPNVIYIGRLQKRKKIEQLIEAVSILKSEGKNCNLVIVGDATNANDLESKAVEYGINTQTWFYGASYQEEVNAQLLYNAHVCACPAEVGLTAVHAMSYGCPVVSNDDIESQMPEHESIIENVTGSFFRNNDIKDLADKIWRWCSVSEEERENTRKSTRQNILDEWSISYQIDVLKSCM